MRCLVWAWFVLRVFSTVTQEESKLAERDVRCSVCRVVASDVWSTVTSNGLKLGRAMKESEVLALLEQTCAPDPSAPKPIPLPPAMGGGLSIPAPPAFALKHNIIKRRKGFKLVSKSPLELQELEKVAPSPDKSAAASMAEAMSGMGGGDRDATPDIITRVCKDIVDSQETEMVDIFSAKTNKIWAKNQKGVERGHERALKGMQEIVCKTQCTQKKAKKGQRSAQEKPQVKSEL